MNKDKGLLIIISGPSGAGKGTVCNAYLERHQETMMSISATTRIPRFNEIEGVNYFFKNEDTFNTMIDNGDFLEYAEVYGNYYGTPKKFVQKQLLDGKDIILEIDIQGALQVKERFDEGVFVFIVPPSMEELKRRIVKRGTENAEKLYKRFQSAYDELNFINRYNYLVLNDTVNNAVQKLEAIVTAERCRISRNRDFYLSLQGGVK